MKRFGLMILCGLAALALNVQTSLALPPFKKAFDTRYVAESGNEEFQAAFKKAGCYTCHVKGEKKDVNNEYGKILAESIEGSAKERLKAAKDAGNEDGEKEIIAKELDAAMTKAEGETSSTGKTYGEMFKAGELPPAPEKK